MEDVWLLCPECGRHFGSKAGVHRKSHHPLEYKWDVLALAAIHSKLWTDGEMYIMAAKLKWWKQARQECSLPEFIQRVLVHWSIMSIKRRWKDADYRAILTEVTLESAIVSSAEADPPHVSTNNDLVEWTSLLKEAFSALCVAEGLDNELLSCVCEGNVDGLLSSLYPQFEEAKAMKVAGKGLFG